MGHAPQAWCQRAGHGAREAAQPPTATRTGVGGVHALPNSTRQRRMRLSAHTACAARVQNHFSNGVRLGRYCGASMQAELEKPSGGPQAGIPDVTRVSPDRGLSAKFHYDTLSTAKDRTAREASLVERYAGKLSQLPARNVTHQTLVMPQHRPWPLTFDDVSVACCVGAKMSNKHDIAVHITFRRRGAVRRARRPPSRGRRSD